MNAKRSIRRNCYQVPGEEKDWTTNAGLGAFNDGSSSYHPR
jgi:hypothetical protein